MITELLAVAGSVLFTVADPQLTEASGIAPGIRSPDVVYVQNDSGDRNRFFALSARDGHTAATVTVPGATNVDWEDLAVATDADGTPSVWLADIGDNDGARDDVVVYRVPEPRVSASGRDRRVETSRPDVWRLRYPSGPTDAESLAVAPGGAAYIVTKSLSGESVVYRMPTRPDPDRVQTPTRVASIRFAFTGTPGGPNPVGQVTATGAAFSRDGSVFAVRTYTDAYVWRVDGSLAATLATPPTRIALPDQPQGEGIAIDGDRLLVDSEGVRQPVYAVPLPTPAAPSATSATTAAPTSAPAEPDDGDTSGSDSTRYLVGGAVVIVLAGVVLLVLRRRR